MDSFERQGVLKDCSTLFFFFCILLYKIKIKKIVQKEERQKSIHKISKYSDNKSINNAIKSNSALILESLTVSVKRAYSFYWDFLWRAQWEILESRVFKVEKKKNSSITVVITWLIFGEEQEAEWAIILGRMVKQTGNLNSQGIPSNIMCFSTFLCVQHKYTYARNTYYVLICSKLILHNFLLS